MRHQKSLDSSNILLGLKGVLRDVAKRLKDGLGKKLENQLKQEFENFSEDGLNSDFIKFDESFALYISDYGDFLSSSLFFPPYSVTLLPQRMIKRDDAKDITWVFLAGFLMRADHFASWVEKETEENIKKFEIEVDFPDVDFLEALELEENKWWQSKVVNDVKEKNCILIAPTGIGKTEFAFAWGEGSKFIFTLPLRVATNQIFERAEKGKNEVPGFGEENVGLLHSDADIFLAERSANLEGEAFLVHELAKHLSLPVIIATGDQFFPSALRYPGYEKIYATLGYSRLIIDEVQAYDPRAAAIVVKLIKDIVALGGKFLLMTATLPEFVNEALNGLDYEKVDLFEEGNFKFPRKHKVEIRKGEIKDAASEIIAKAKEGKRVLVVLNTVEKTQEVYEEISKETKGIETILLHSRFTFNHRKDKENLVVKKLEIRQWRSQEKELEEKWKNQEGTIIVATQIVEASLDIDADYLYTEIAPADSLVQRMGRVLRGVRPKEKGNVWDRYKALYREEANVIVFVKEPGEYESGKGRVYKNYLIEATLLVLNALTENKGKKEILKEWMNQVDDEYSKKNKKKKKVEKPPRNYLLDKLKEKTREVLNSGCNFLFLEEVKAKWVEEVYNKEFLLRMGYLQDFYNALEALEAGYVSERRDEAQRLFREIRSINVIPEDKVDRVKEEIEKFKDDIRYTDFKNKFLNEFVVPINESTVVWKWKKNLIPLETYLDKNIPEKLKRYIKGIYVVDVDYDTQKGVYEEKKNDTDNIV